MQDVADSKLSTAHQTYPHLHAFMRLHAMRPFVAQRLREYRLTMLQAVVSGEEEAAYYRGRLALTKERYIQATVKLHELLVEIVMLNAKNKVIQERCLRLIHAPFPTLDKPPVNLEDEAMHVWFEASVIDIDESVEEDYLQPIEELILMLRDTQ